MTCSHLRELLTCVKQFMSWVDHAPCVYIYIYMCVLPLAQVQSTMRSLHQADDYRDHQCSSLDWSVAMQWVQMNHIIKVSIWATSAVVYCRRLILKCIAVSLAQIGRQQCWYTRMWQDMSHSQQVEDHFYTFRKVHETLSSDMTHPQKRYDWKASMLPQENSNYTRV